MTATISAPLAAYSADQLRKAIRLVQAGHVRHVEGGHEYLVIGTDGAARYITDAYRQTCTCRAGQLGRPCYHLAAALAINEGAGR